MTIWQRWRQTALHNKALVLSSAIVAFGTLFYTAAAIVQVCMFDRSSEQAAKQTDKLIEAANVNAEAARQIAAASKRNATAAESFSASAGNINTQMGKTVDKLQAQGDRIEAARKSSIEASQKALQATIDNFRQEQRAWVSLDPAEVRGALPHQVVAILKNTGNTPAHKVQAISGMFMVRGAMMPDAAFANWMGDIIEQVRRGVWAGGTVLRTIRQPSEQWKERMQHLTAPEMARELENFRQEMIRQDRDGREVLPTEVFGEGNLAETPFIESIGVISPRSTYSLNVRVGDNFMAGSGITVVVYGKIFYEDDFGEPRETVFCRYAPNANAPDWKSCPVFNDMK